VKQVKKRGGDGLPATSTERCSAGETRLGTRAPRTGLADERGRSLLNQNSWKESGLTVGSDRGIIVSFTCRARNTRPAGAEGVPVSMPLFHPGPGIPSASLASRAFCAL